MGCLMLGFRRCWVHSGSSRPVPSRPRRTWPSRTSWMCLLSCICWLPSHFLCKPFYACCTTWIQNFHLCSWSNLILRTCIIQAHALIALSCFSILSSQVKFLRCHATASIIRTTMFQRWTSSLVLVFSRRHQIFSRIVGDHIEFGWFLEGLNKSEMILQEREPNRPRI